MLNDLRLSFRSLKNTPGFTLIAFLTLSLGIGATTAMFSVVNAVLFKPLPYSNPDQLVMVREAKPEVPESQVSPAIFLAWREQNTVFDQLEALYVSDVNLTGAGSPEWLSGMKVTTGFFSMLGTPPLIGRDFLPEDNDSISNVAIISYALWQSKFGGSAEIINKTISLDEHQYTVIGVMPKASNGLLFRLPDVWMPLVLSREHAQIRKTRTLFPLARIKKNVSLEQARQEMSAIAGRLATEYPDTNAGWTVKIFPLLEYAVSGMKSALLLMLATVMFVLLIACTNIANLLLARAAARRKEIAIRFALGASRWRIIRQLLSESALLSLSAGCAGWAMTVAATNIIVKLVPDWYKPRTLDASVDGRMLAFAIGVTLLTGLSFGLVPALQASKPNLNEILKDSGRGTGDSRRNQRIRSTLIVAEFAMSLILLVGAGLFTKSFILVNRVDPGFDSRDTLAVSLSLPVRKYPQAQQRAGFYTALLERVSNLPGVIAAGASSEVPFSNAHFGGDSGTFEIDGKPAVPKGEQPGTVLWSVSSDYFETLKIRLLSGRLFTDNDSSSSLGVAIINATMARKFFGGANPIGERIKINEAAGSVASEFREIVGVVDDIRERIDEKTSAPQTYIPFLQRPSAYMTLVVRSTMDVGALTGSIREQVESLDADLPIFQTATLDRLISGSLEERRFSAWLFVVFCNGGGDSRGSRDVWSDVLRGFATNSRDRNSNGARCAIEGCCEAYRSQGIRINGRRFDDRIIWCVGSWSFVELVVV
jgi:predicted permease